MKQHKLLNTHFSLSLLATLLATVACSSTSNTNSPPSNQSPSPTASLQKGNVIFIHPDGTSPSHWGATRFFHYGPDGRLNWDQMNHSSIYLGHMKNQLTGTSNAGAVTHATGVKVRADSFGLDEAGQPVTAASGKRETIMQAAIAQGYGTALINSGIISEPGTGALWLKSKIGAKMPKSLSKFWSRELM